MTLKMPTLGPTAPLEETAVQAPRPFGRLLIDGFRLAVRNWPCVLWVYAVTLVFALLTAVPVTYGLSPYIDHSLEAEKIAGTLNLTALAELGLHLSDDGFFPMVLRSARWVQSLELLILFVLFAGSVVVFVSGERPRLSVLLREGVRYFWRFVRAALIAGFVVLILVGSLAALRGLLLDHLSDFAVERQMFRYAAFTGLIVAAAALLVRLWWDLVETYIARGAIEGEPRVRQSLLPAWQLLRHHFWSLLGGFLVPGIAAVAAFLISLYLWKLLPAHQVWGAMLLAQIGLFCLVAGRFWQRGVETVLVMSAAMPRIVREDPLAQEIAVEVVAPPEPETPELAPQAITSLPEDLADSPEPEMPGLAPLAPTPFDPAPLGTSLIDPSLPEPTLQDLLRKLRDQPWATSDTVTEMPPASAPPPPPEPTRADPVTEPYTALLERHMAKIPLGTKPGTPEAKRREDLPKGKKDEDSD